jgi:hypothetical protein
LMSTMRYARLMDDRRNIDFNRHELPFPDLPFPDLPFPGAFALSGAPGSKA